MYRPDTTEGVFPWALETEMRFEQREALTI
jgi:hypothetical protein